MLTSLPPQRLRGDEMSDLPEQPAIFPGYAPLPRIRRRGFRDGRLLPRDAATRFVAHPELLQDVLALPIVGFVAGKFPEQLGAITQAPAGGVPLPCGAAFPPETGRHPGLSLGAMNRAPTGDRLSS